MCWLRGDVPETQEKDLGEVRGQRGRSEEMVVEKNESD